MALNDSDNVIGCSQRLQVGADVTEGSAHHTDPRQGHEENPADARCNGPDVVRGSGLLRRAGRQKGNQGYYGAENEDQRSGLRCGSVRLMVRALSAVKKADKDVRPTPAACGSGTDDRQRVQRTQFASHTGQYIKSWGNVAKSVTLGQKPDDQADRDLLAHADDKPTIGLLLCKSKNNLVAEYALRTTSMPIGVSEWKAEIVESLPEEFAASLPSISELEAELSHDV